jgi:hypothetical protein
MAFELNKTLVISTQDLINYCAFSELLEAKAIEPYIFTVQHQYLKPLLCAELYSEILEQIESNTLSYENQELISGTSDNNYLGLTPYLAWLAYREYIIRGNVRSTQSGLVVYTSDTTEAPNEKLMDLIVKDTTNKINFYRAEVVNFLEENKSTYPLWGCDCGNVKNNNNIGITSVQDDKYNFGLRVGVIKRK